MCDGQSDGRTDRWTHELNNMSPDPEFDLGKKKIPHNIKNGNGVV